MSRRRCFILIDGSNFYFKLKDLKLHNLTKFDFSGFTKMLSGKNKIVKSIYHIGAVRTDGTKKANKMHANQQKLFSHLKKHNFEYSLGYLLKADGKYHEKGLMLTLLGIFM